MPIFTPRAVEQYDTVLSANSRAVFYKISPDFAKSLLSFLAGRFPLLGGIRLEISRLLLILSPCL